ncbi:hypothetical protein MHYP_G00102440 [Metynnis hypsauchen]
MLKVAKEECLIWKLAELRSCAPEPPMVSELDLGMTMGPDTIEPHTTTPKDPEAYSSTLMSIQSHSLHAQTDRSESTLGEPKASACTWTSPQSYSPPALADRSEPTLRDSEAAPKPRRPPESLHLKSRTPKVSDRFTTSVVFKVLDNFQEFNLGSEPTKKDRENAKTLTRFNCLSPAERGRDTELHVEAPEEVTEGETADLTCKTTCSLTDPTFIWYKDGRPLTTKTIKNNQLHLQTVSSEDAGSYSCAVRGDQHLNSTAHSLRVRYPPKNISVSISPSGEIVEGSSVTLTCSSDGNPPVKIYTWFKEGRTSPVGSGQNYSIISITADHTGLYYCVAQNDLGAQRSAGVPVFFKDFLRAGERGRMEIQINQSMRMKAVKTTAPVHLLKTSPAYTRMLLSLRSSTETITSSVYHTHNCSNSPLDSHS